MSLRCTTADAKCKVYSISWKIREREPKALLLLLLCINPCGLVSADYVYRHLELKGSERVKEGDAENKLSKAQQIDIPKSHYSGISARPDPPDTHIISNGLDQATN